MQFQTIYSVTRTDSHILVRHIFKTQFMPFSYARERSPWNHLQSTVPLEDLTAKHCNWLCRWVLIWRATFNSERQRHHHQSFFQSLFFVGSLGMPDEFPINMQIRITSICFDSSIIIFSAQLGPAKMSTLQIYSFLSSKLNDACLWFDQSLCSGQHKCNFFIFIFFPTERFAVYVKIFCTVHKHWLSLIVKNNMFTGVREDFSSLLI